jgi:hypothetical protein
MSNGTCIFLCDVTGNMAEPWVAAGYDAVLVDPQHAPGVHREGRITKIGTTVDKALYALGRIMKHSSIVFVAGFPPCTDVAVSGARWWEAKREKDPYFQAKAAVVAAECRTIGGISGAPYFFENPVSAFSKIFGKPDHTFHPHDFTGHEPADNYTKLTCLWTGNGFVMPEPFRDATAGAPDDRIHKAPPGDERANFRSATPRGFAKAVFLSNAPHLRAQLSIAA